MKLWKEHKKRKAAAVAAAVIVSALAISGAVAYDTVEQPAEYDLETGKVAVELHQLDGEGESFDVSALENAVPGQRVADEVTVENVGKSPAWVRVRVNKIVTLADDTVSEEGPGYIHLDIDEGHWSADEDGWYYYNNPLPIESEGTNAHVTEPLFTTVSLDGGMGNEYQKCKVELELEVDAVQTAFNGETVDAAAGWPTQD